ncbi:MAG: tRNA (N(6)-L-threonylcarbamoyladenosine(37)-C(2))-methylthiotransferase MtaB [Bauldia litoralis]
MEPHILTFGCRLNTQESEVMRRHARDAGLADAVIVNTCAVTAEAERQARQAIRRARRERPQARIIVTGCAAQIAPETWAGMPEVDTVLGNREKLDRASFAPASFAIGDDEPVRVNDIMEVGETAAHLVGGFEGRARAFVQVQNGCDHRCTFCIIPFGRGNSRSVPLGPIVEQVRALVADGVAELVLTGVDITSYGHDLPGAPTLGRMIRRLLAAVPELKRLRLTSLDACEIDPDLMELIATDDRLMPHLHLSLQAGDDMILKRMKRRHSRDDAIRLCESVRRVRPDMAFGADLIAGFPTETEDMFRRSLDLVDECGLTYLHVFPYSERPGTPAAKMPAVPKAERKARAARLREKGADALARFLGAQAGQTRTLLVESPDRGRTDHYAPVRLRQPAEPGTVARGRVVETTPTELIAEAA